ncbi:aldehyde dehydrogenase family protein [Mycobacterium sp. CVI_P3]|uniref:Aldehyde dehydrogenase family protein n=1 Tax=Mycobacterium pinniadriaticum TaxID=2994102 RepID=A0ABT3SCF1_9MYCO|nr:aldehyde dehydrogenase family protein [Mycobacterium pinniadriaticum]MCX2930638.1 aldehyde dehydrogenase family protein [Mycobacterium pinniadriaticum]MCX2937062.1 aldehyde dehydrogenase family protein [Mycobacterium pinniadriaticum]
MSALGTRLLIDGALVGDTGLTSDVIDPSTGAVVRTLPLGGLDELDAALAAARSSFDGGGWPCLAASDRVRILLRLADLIEVHADDFARFVETEVGTCRRVAGPGQVARPMDHYRDMVARAGVELGRALPQLPGPPVTGQRVVREPRGVVAAITPWNAPHLLNLWKVGPALATGNTMVLKPAPEAPSCALLLGELAVEAGLPAGVLNVITGGADVGRAMVCDPRVDMVAFTGSSAVGRAIAQSAGATLKHTLLELGGKSALLALPDADVPSLVAAVMRFVTLAGQGCGLLTRVLVPDSLHDIVVAGLVDAVRRVKVGPAGDPETVMGPVISAAARDRIEGTIRAAVAEGATVACGGGRPDGVPVGGFYLEPTILTGLTNNTTIAREEVFGPVIAVIRYSGDPDEGVRLANDSPYGLVGAVWTSDTALGLQLASRIRAGQVRVNATASGNEAPFGGYKQSGVGREVGLEGVLEYTTVKYVAWQIPATNNRSI